MDVVNIKISKFGGLTKARQARDLCVSLGIAMTIEDSWGGDIVTAAIAHLAHSTPTEFLFTSTDFNSYVTAEHRRRRPAASQRTDGRLDRSRAGGLALDGRARPTGARSALGRSDPCQLAWQVKESCQRADGAANVSRPLPACLAGEGVLSAMAKEPCNVPKRRCKRRNAYKTCSPARQAGRGHVAT